MQSKIITIVILSFIFTIPTWYMDKITDENLRYYIVWDGSLLLCKSLIPLMGAYVIQERRWKIIFMLYFGLTMFNLIDTVLMYYGYQEIWQMEIKIGLAGIITLFFLYLTWKTNESDYI